jgi:membrane protein implicated in regulation of membrane protease activity
MKISRNIKLERQRRLEMYFLLIAVLIANFVVLYFVRRHMKKQEHKQVHHRVHDAVQQYFALNAGRTASED